MELREGKIECPRLTMQEDKGQGIQSKQASAKTLSPLYYVLKFHEFIPQVKTVLAGLWPSGLKFGYITAYATRKWIEQQPVK